MTLNRFDQSFGDDRGSAIIIALVAARMSARYQSLALKAALFGGLAWVIGVTVAIITDGPLL